MSSYLHISASGLSLWPHQQQAREATHQAIASGRRSGLIVLPTGGGKTVTFLTIARDLGEPTLILVHREELIQQAAKAAVRVWPEATIGIIRAESDDWQEGQQIVIASVQSLHERRRLRMPRDRFGLVIIDEAHHTAAELYQAVLGHFDQRRFLLGVTATPDRLDGVGLCRWYGDTPLFTLTIREAVDLGILVRPRQHRVRTQVSLDTVAVRGGDFAEGQLAQAVNTPERNTSIVEAFQEHAPGRRAVAFCADVQHAKDLAKMFEAAGVAAHVVTGELGRQERADILEGFARGQFRVVTTCQVLTEGFDDPAVDAIIMARPTASRSLYIQCIGRGLRMHPGKQDCMILDITDNCKRHQLIAVTDLADVPVTPMQEPEGDKAIREEDAEIDEGDDTPAEVGPVVWTIEEIPPWPEMPTLFDYRPLQKWEFLPATENQIRCLRAFGLAPTQSLTRGQASNLIDQANKLDAEHPTPATPKQQWFLKQCGRWRAGMSKREASRIIGQLKGQTQRA